MKLSFDCEPLDKLLDGGIEAGVLTAIYGEGGSGKTNLCFQLSKNAIKNGNIVLYIDTEGVSIDRLRQICGNDFSEISKKIFFYKIYSLSEQDIAIDKVIQFVDSNENVGLIVLDSGSVFYRAMLGTEEEIESMRFFSQQVIKLLTLARKKNLHIIITAQVYTNIETNQIEPIGGQTLKHNAKSIIRLEKIGKNKRRATLIKHRSLPEDEYADFMITENGINNIKKIFG